MIRLRRKWEVFPGNNRFYCDGRIMLARQCGVLPLTIGLIVITSGLFFTFDCPFLVHHLTVFIPVIGGMLFVFVIFTLLQTSFTEPGILPRALPDEAADVERQIDNSGSSTYRPPPRTKEILINDQVQICNLNPSCTIVELVICFFSIWSVLGLSGFHTYLVAANLTTNEDIKGSWSSKRGEESGNPYTYNNIFTNCCVVLCGPMPPRSVLHANANIIAETDIYFIIHSPPKILLKKPISLFVCEAMKDVINLRLMYIQRLR
uniref:Probable palmitoyltransferase ZDHHC14 n=1 Tax=Sinocyclocheilus grahami TaxID=75366 RepID=A0A672KCM7_SINGR